MTHDQQAEIAALKILATTMLLHAVDPDGSVSNEDALERLSSLRAKCHHAIARMQVDLSGSAATSDEPFRGLVRGEIDALFDSFTPGT